MQPLNPRILCIEDDVDTCDMLTLSLEMSGYEVVSAHTAAEGVDKASGAEFDIMLLFSHSLFQSFVIGLL